MEDTIRKIMDDELMGDARDLQRCAEKIADTFERFIEWLCFEENDFYPQSDIHNESKVAYWNIETNKYYSLKEIFSYWLENVKPKDTITTHDLQADDEARAKR